MSTERFQRLLRIREAQENEVAVELAAALETLVSAERQRDQLLDYQREYLEAVLPSDTTMLKQMAYMRQQLRVVLDQQERRIVQAQGQVDEVRGRWLERHQATLSLERLIERRRAQDTVEENRRLQREQDMWATRRAFDQIHSSRE